MMSEFIDLTGQKFGRLTVIKRVENDKQGGACFLCLCDCGNETKVNGTKLRKNLTQSCGCLQRENMSKRTKTHGKTNTRIFKIWQGMIERCCSKNIHNFNEYGGRGITVCNEWKNDFMTFYNWAIKNGYKDRLTIDRINVNGNYEPSNCRWATKKEQANNRRNNKLITYKGKTLNQKQWEEFLNLPYGTILRRLKAKWSIEKTMNTPIKRYKNAKAK